LFRRARSRRTRLIVVDQITSPTARRFPTAEIASDAAEHGVRTLVDGAHAPGLIEDPASVAGGDWWFGNLHKWPCAPRGAALLATTAGDRDELWPLIDSWGADEPYPGRFDTQGTIDATSYMAAPRAIEFIEREFGWHAAREALASTADAAATLIGDALQPYVATPAVTDVAMPVPTMRLIRLPDGVGVSREDADALRMELFDTQNVETAFTSFQGIGYFRLSVHLYTTPDDVDAFVERCVPAIVRIAQQRQFRRG
jgi:isopenicillin-N epimerase